jgi:hypothetical protein
VKGKRKRADPGGGGGGDRERKRVDPGGDGGGDGEMGMGMGRWEGCALLFSVLSRMPRCKHARLLSRMPRCKHARQRKNGQGANTRGAKDDRPRCEHARPKVAGSPSGCHAAQRPEGRRSRQATQELPSAAAPRQLWGRRRPASVPHDCGPEA